MKKIFFIYFNLLNIIYLNGLENDEKFSQDNTNFINCYGKDQICSPVAKCQINPNEKIGKCVCDNKYTGDGILCEPKVELKKHECDKDSDCSLYGRCVLETANNVIGALPEFNPSLNGMNLVSSRRICSCMQGYVRLSNGSCVNENDAPCDIVPNCHENANCKYSIYKRQYECDCNDNYKGDGKNCVPILEQCDKLNNCDEKAECVFNYQIREYQCSCLPGYTGDGYFCKSKESCKTNSSLCDSNAECTFNNRLGEFECVCSQNYFGDGHNCKLLKKHGEEHIIFAQGMSLLSIFTEKETDKNKLLLTKPLQTPVGLDVDCLEGFIYWADLTNKAIHRAPYNGSYIETVLQGENESPEGIAIDWISRNIYWTDSQRDVIEVMTLDGSKHKVLINTDLVEPRGIVVHPELGKMYWTDWNRQNPKIEQANMDGTARSVMVTGSLGLPNMLTIDYKSNDLCWTDAGLRRIECIRLNGLERRIIYTPANYPFDLTISGQYLYWTDWHKNEIYKVHKNGGSSEVVNLPQGGHGKLYGIVTVPSQCPHMSNRCAYNNGNCKHLCLPNNIGGRICVCPDNKDIDCNSKIFAINQF